MKRTLLTFTGFHDPWGEANASGERLAGPVLTVAHERRFDAIFLFTTPNLLDRTMETKDALEKRLPRVRVELVDIPLKDPTNYLGLLRQLRAAFKTIHAGCPDADYFISVSSGTPHMHATWLLLAASGEIPATILQASRPEHVAPGKPAVREIDLLQPEFPRITRPLRADAGAPQADPSAACAALGIIGSDLSFTRALEQAAAFSNYDDIHVLLLGAPGTGKEQFASLIHHLSPRASRAFVAVNCGSLPENLVESQLFGHKRGAFTGATTDQEGKFKAANGGTLFLDEIGELPLTAQAKLLRVLEQGEIEPIGAPRPTNVNTRVVAATNRDLSAMVAAGTFRADLLSRFGSSVSLPLLRERATDVPALAIHLLDAFNARYQRQRRLTASALQRLTRYPWPGNVRELRNVIQQSAMLCPRAIIDADDLQFDLRSASVDGMLPEPEPGFQLTAWLDGAKARLIQRALDKTGGVQAQAARLLGVTPQALNQDQKRRGHQRP